MEEKPIKMLPSTASCVRLSAHAEGSGSKALIRASVPEFLVSEFVEDVEGMEVKNSTEYPHILRRIIAEYAELFQERSETYRIMTEMPEGRKETLTRTDPWRLYLIGEQKSIFFLLVRKGISIERPEKKGWRVSTRVHKGNLRSTTNIYFG